jgi:hypothetical protein
LPPVTTEKALGSALTGPRQPSDTTRLVTPIPKYASMHEVPAKARWFQFELRNVFLATFWLGAACASATMHAGIFRGQAVAPIWLHLTTFSLLAAFWSLRGRYWNILGTWAFAAVYFLLLFWFHKQAILG